MSSSKKILLLIFRPSVVFSINSSPGVNARDSVMTFKADVRRRYRPSFFLPSFVGEDVNDIATLLANAFIPKKIKNLIEKFFFASNKKLC